jgi:hypothetical protein
MARWVERDPGGAGGGNLYSYGTISTVWQPEPYGVAPPDEEPRLGKRPPGDPIPPPGSSLIRGTVSADSVAGRYIACEDARIAKLRHPLAGTFTNNWHGRSWFEETWDTARHMDPHEVLDALGVVPVVGTLADLANAGLYAYEGRYGEAAFSVGAAIPGLGDIATASKGLRRAVKWGTCDVLKIKCFVAGTLVLTPLGPVPIESILPGDEVVSVDAETGAPVVAKVLGVSRGIAAEPCSEVTVDAGNRGSEGFAAHGLETFTATDGHPFLVLSGERLDLRGDAEHVPLYEPLGTPRGRWVRAAELLPGDTVATRSGSATVVRVAPHARPEVVYNLHVEGTARYLVGACGVVVHNSPCSEAAEGAARGGRGDLPARGKPNSSASRDDGNGRGQIREYGDDGRASKDFDFGHDHGAGDPHVHDWDWSKPSPRQPGRPLRKGE